MNEACNLESLRILVVDDALENQVLLTRTLESCGARVEAAENGLEGVTKCLRDNYDVVLMDIQMPVLDGVQATMHLRKCGYLGRIVACSSVNPQDEPGGKVFDDYIPKPVDLGVLVHRLRRVHLMKLLKGTSAVLKR